MVNSGTVEAEMTPSAPASEPRPNAHHIEELLGELPEAERGPLRLGMTLTRLSRISEALHEQSAGAFGLNGSEATTLVALLASGPEHRMLPTEIRTRVAHTSAGVTGILRRLESKRLVSRAADPSDGRRVLITLTPAGEETVLTFLRERARAFAEHFDGIDGAALGAMTDTIDEVLLRLERAAGYSPAFRRRTSD